MSAPRPKNQAWHKEHYDKIAVVVVLIALLGSALFLLVQIGQAQRALSDVQAERIHIRQQPYQPRDLNEFIPFVQELETPFQIAARTNQLLVSELRVVSSNPEIPTPILYGANVCPWTGHVEVDLESVDTTGDGIPDRWYVQYGLDPFDPELASRDLDGDGFTVREEFEAKTSPVDAADHPSHAYKLRVRRVATRPFDLRFQGVQEISEGEILFMLNVRGQDRSYFSRMGDVVHGYRIVGFDTRTREGMHGRPIDASVLKLERGDGRQVALVINTDVTIDDRIAELVFLVDRSMHRVNVGDELTLMGQTYKVVDILRDTVLIRDQGREEVISVPMMTQSERDAPADATPRGLEAFFEGLTE